MERDCKHGVLARNCLICEMEIRIQNLGAELSQWRGIAEGHIDALVEKTLSGKSMIKESSFLMGDKKVRDVLERIINLAVPGHGTETAIRDLAWAALYSDHVPTWKELELLSPQPLNVAEDGEIEAYRQACYRTQLELAQERSRTKLYEKHMGEWKEKCLRAEQGREELRRHLRSAKARISELTATN